MKTSHWKLIQSKRRWNNKMKKAVIAFVAAAALAFGSGVYAQTDTPTPTTSPVPTVTTTQPAGAPSTGFGGAQ
jgi:hypothetical protein